MCDVEGRTMFPTGDVQVQTYGTHGKAPVEFPRDLNSRTKQ